MKLDPEMEAKILAMPGTTVNGKPAFAPLPAIEAEDEKDFQRQFIKEAEKNCWLCYHVKFSYQSKAGFPDVWMAKDRIIHVELKTEEGELTAAQLTFRDAILAANGEWYCFRPSDWPIIVKLLEGK